MTAATYIPIIVAVVTAAFGMIVYIVQKRVDRHNSLVELKRKIYQEFLAKLLALSDNKPGALQEINSATLQLLVVASDEVARKVGAWKHYMAETSPGRAERSMKIANQLMADFMLAMRQDCFENSTLTEEQLKLILPIEG